MNELLAINFTASNTVRNRRPYTIYEIEVTSTTTAMPWLLYKRYSDFDAFHAALVKSLQTSQDPKEKDIIRQLPQLSPKRFRPLTTDVVNKRQIELQEYLQDLMAIPELYTNNLLLDFLAVPDTLRGLLRQRPPESDPSSPARMSTSRGPATQEAIQIEDLLKQLNYEQNRVKSLAKFEQWYFDRRPKIPDQYIRTLLVGDQAHQGLIHACGTVAYSKVAWRAALALLVRLMDIERNKDARLFQNIFVNVDRAMFHQLNLHRHITDPTTQENGFKIVQLIRNRRPDIPFSYYVQEEPARDEYEKWEQVQLDTHMPQMREPEEKDEAIFNWNEQPAPQIAADIFRGFERLSRDKDGFRVLDMSRQVPITIKYKRNLDDDTWVVKARFISNYSATQVFDLLKNGGVSFGDKFLSWNVKVIERDVIEVIDNDHDILYEVYKNFNSPYKYRDFVLMRACRSYEIQTGSGARHTCYNIAMASIGNYERCPETADRTRTTLLPSGFEVGPTEEDPSRSHVSIRFHMTPESVLMVSPDLLGETDELIRSIEQIDELLGAAQGRL